MPLQQSQPLSQAIINNNSNNSVNGVATVHLAPIIKTNAAQAMALDINMLHSLHRADLK